MAGSAGERWLTRTVSGTTLNTIRGTFPLAHYPQVIDFTKLHTIRTK